MSLRDTVEALRHEGLRVTPSRQAILEVVIGSRKHLRVSEVFARAKAIAPGIGLSTVYRTMDLLARLDLVRNVHVEHRHQHYARARGGHAHHLVCSDCGLVVEFGRCRMDAVARRLSAEMGFQIDGHCLEFFGRCRGCRKMRRA